MKTKILNSNLVEKQDVVSEIFEESFNFQNLHSVSKTKSQIVLLGFSRPKSEVVGFEAAPLKRDNLSIPPRILFAVSSLLASAFGSVICLCTSQKQRDAAMNDLWF
jgi:hypothetical protein